MVDIQSPTAEIRRGKKKKERRKKPQDKNIMSASATQGGHSNYVRNCALRRSSCIKLTRQRIKPGLSWRYLGPRSSRLQRGYSAGWARKSWSH